MATSGSTNWGLNRNEVITLALRRCKAVGEGETPQAAAITDAAVALNAIVKEWGAFGMPLWKLVDFSITPVASTSNYQIKVGGTVNRYPPNRIIQAWYEKDSEGITTPLELITRDTYYKYTDRESNGTPTSLWFDPAGNQGNTSQEPAATVYLYKRPDSTFASAHTIHCIGEFPFEDFDASTDYPDFPAYFNNALAWELACDLAYEYGVGNAEKAQMERRAERSLQRALSNVHESGSLFIQPSARYGS